MSSALMPNIGSDESKIAIVNSVISKIENSFNEDNSAVKKCADEALVALRKLRSAVDRQRAECVASMVQKGDLKTAANKLSQNYGLIEVGKLEEILQLSISGDESACSLKNVINFIDHITLDLQEMACVAIYNEMRFRNQTTDVLILLLWSKIKKWFPATGLEEIKLKLSEDVERLFEELVAEVMNATEDESMIPLSKKIIDTCSVDVFNVLIPEVVKKIFDSGDQVDVSLLVNYSEELPFLCCSFHVIGATFTQLKKGKLLKTKAALHLWAHAQYVMTEEVAFSTLSLADQQLVTDTHSELSKHREYFFKMVRKSIEENNFVESSSMTSLIKEFVQWYYNGNFENTKPIILAAEKAFYYTCSGRMQKSLYGEMKNHKHLVTFEAFQLYHSVQKMTKLSDYDSAASAFVDMEFVRARVPKCLKHLLWGERRRCRIVSKCFGEPIFADVDSGAVKFQVNLWVPGTFRGDQLWSLSVDEDTSLVSISKCDKWAWLGCTSKDGRSAVLAEPTKSLWMIKAVDEDHVKIFKSEDEYLTADLRECNTDANNRGIHLRSENNTDMQLWQIEFSK